jgi:hypothetical protein
MDPEIPIEFRVSFGLDNFDAEHTRLFAISHHFKMKRKIDKLESANKRLKTEVADLQKERDELKAELKEKEIDTEEAQESETQSESESDKSYSVSETEGETEGESEMDAEMEEQKSPKPKKRRSKKDYDEPPKTRRYAKSSIGPYGYLNRATIKSSRLLPYTQPIHIGKYGTFIVRFFGDFENPYCLLKDLCDIVGVDPSARVRLMYGCSTPDEKAKIMYADPKKDEFMIISEKGSEQLFQTNPFMNQHDLHEWYRAENEKIKST